MLDRKKDIAQEIAYLVVQNEITKISKLHKNIRHSYRGAKIPTFGGNILFERTFIFVAAEHIFHIDLSNSRPFKNMAEMENLYHNLLEDPKNAVYLKFLDERNLTWLLFLNFSHVECNVVSTADLMRINRLLARNRQIEDKIKQTTQRYIGYKIIEAVNNGKISCAKEKEEAKMCLSDYFVVPALSDEEIIRLFGWHSLTVSKEKVAEVFRALHIKTE